MKVLNQTLKLWPKIQFVFVLKRSSSLLSLYALRPLKGLMIMGTEIATRMLWQEMRYSLTRRAILDFIATTEACFVSWEIITLFTVYGMQAFIPLLFLNLIQK